METPEKDPENITETTEIRPENTGPNPAQKTYRDIFIDESKFLSGKSADEILSRIHKLDSALNELKARQASAAMLYSSLLREAGIKEREELKKKDREYHISEETRKRWREEDAPKQKKQPSKADLQEMLAKLKAQLKAVEGQK